MIEADFQDSGVFAETRRLAFFGGHCHLARPALMAERDDQPRVQSVRTETAVHLAIELALDHHADQARAKARFAGTPRRRTAALLPVELEGGASGCPIDGPFEHQAPAVDGKAAIFA